MKDGNFLTKQIFPMPISTTDPTLGFVYSSRSPEPGEDLKSHLIVNQRQFMDMVDRFVLTKDFLVLARKIVKLANEGISPNAKIFQLIKETMTKRYAGIYVAFNGRYKGLPDELNESSGYLCKGVRNVTYDLRENRIVIDFEVVRTGLPPEDLEAIQIAFHYGFDAVRNPPMYRGKPLLQ